MKAAQINEYGDASVITISEVKKPTVQAGQVLVEVHAASINPIDAMILSGAAKQMAPLNFPATLGGDFAGVVAEVGEKVTHVAVGDKVYGQANAAFGGTGTYAQFTAAVATQVAKAPNNVDFNGAASLPLAGVSALQALTEHINLQKGQKILIIGGAGGIGSIAVQLAKHLGAYVAAIASGEGLQFVKQLGADEAIDYKTQDFAKLLKEYDAVFDTAGGDNFDQALSILKAGGIAVSMIAKADETKASELGITAISQMTQVTSQALSKLAQLVEEGMIQPQVAKVFHLDDITTAFNAKKESDILGKVVIEIN